MALVGFMILGIEASLLFRTCFKRGTKPLPSPREGGFCCGASAPCQQGSSEHRPAPLCPPGQHLSSWPAAASGSRAANLRRWPEPHYLPRTPGVRLLLFAQSYSTFTFGVSSPGEDFKGFSRSRGAPQGKPGPTPQQC